MGTLNITLPDTLREFVDGQVTERRYGTSSEYVRELIRHDQERRTMRAPLLEGAASPPSGEADAEYFQTLRSQVAAYKPVKRRA